jgi:hypothetical protein
MNKLTGKQRIASETQVPNSALYLPLPRVQSTRPRWLITREIETS